MTKSPVYTIGYGNRTFDEFSQLLKLYKIKYIIDVRSKPFSKYHKEFCQDILVSLLKNIGVRYVFMGDTLGGHPQDESCYTDGKVDYNKLKDTSVFKDGLKRLITAFEKNLCVALMCSESKPQHCHRSKLIGQELFKSNIAVMHIDELGKPVTQNDVVMRLTGGQESLFCNNELGFSNRRIKL